MSRWTTVIVLLFSLGAFSQDSKTIYESITNDVKIYKRSPSTSQLKKILQSYVELYSYTKSYHSYHHIMDEYKKNPKSFLTKAKKILSKRGYLIIESNLKSLQRERTKGTDF